MLLSILRVYGSVGSGASVLRRIYQRSLTPLLWLAPSDDQGPNAPSRQAEIRNLIRSGAWVNRYARWAEEPIVQLILDGTVLRVRLDKKATLISLLVALGFPPAPALSNGLR
jgi:hypothetical protein